MKYQQNNQNQQDRIKQLLEQFCDYYDIEKQQTVINNPRYKKHNYNDTFAIYLEQHDIPTPKEFQYDPLYIIDCNRTTAMRIAEKGIVPSKHWEHDPSLKDRFGDTVAIYLSKNGIIPPKQWEYQNATQDNEKWTVAMYLSYNGILPPKQWNHNPNIKNQYGFTVQDYLQSNNIEVPDEWKTDDCGVENKRVIKQLSEFCRLSRTNKDIIINNPSHQDSYNKYTFAMHLFSRRIIPPKQFYHNPNIKNYNNKTVREQLEQLHFPIPNEWYDEQYKKNHKFKPQYLNDALYGIITDRPQNVRADTQYERRMTIAMIYANQGIIPPECWNHDPKLQYKQSSVAMLLAENKILVPKQWYHDPNLQDDCENTVAMTYSRNGKIPPKEWEHKPDIQDSFGRTVAIFLSQKGILPPKQWEHDPRMSDEFQCTVQDYLKRNGIDIPQQWKIINKQIQMTNEIKQKLKEYCKQCYIQNQQTIIDYPQYQKFEFKDTFAIFLELNGIQTPKEFQYDPEYIIKDTDTTAMHLVQYGIIPSQCWNHNPLLKNNDGDTVGIILSKQGIIPPKEWMHDIDITNKYGHSIRLFLYIYGYYYINNEFIKLTQDNFKQYIQTELTDNICQICLEEGQQEFIVSTCTHKVCLNCFKEMIKFNTYEKCPLCRKKCWFK